MPCPPSMCGSRAEPTDARMPALPSGALPFASRSVQSMSSLPIRTVQRIAETTVVGSGAVLGRVAVGRSPQARASAARNAPLGQRSERAGNEVTVIPSEGTGLTAPAGISRFRDVFSIGRCPRIHDRGSSSGQIREYHPPSHRPTPFGTVPQTTASRGTPRRRSSRSTAAARSTPSRKSRRSAGASSPRSTSSPATRSSPPSASRSRRTTSSRPVAATATTRWRMAPSAISAASTRGCARRCTGTRADEIPDGADAGAVR